MNKSNQPSNRFFSCKLQNQIYYIRIIFTVLQRVVAFLIIYWIDFSRRKLNYYKFLIFFK